MSSPPSQHTTNSKNRGFSLSTPNVVEDCFRLLKLYSDGSIYRSKDIKGDIPIHDDGSVIWKDCLYKTTHNLYMRLYKPRDLSGQKLPIVCYLHAGGFCFGSRASPNFHNSCLSLCKGLHVLIVAPDYRLAPEHRLPAAINDSEEALKWLKSQAMAKEGEPWLRGKEVEFDRVFIMGDSSGGNMAHHLAVRLGVGSLELEPVRVRGYVLLSPFFGGLVRTKSEEERPCEGFWNMDMYDRFWRLSLPEGADKDHPLANPLGTASSELGKIAVDHPILVLVGGEEMLRERVEEYAKKLEELGKKVKYIEFEGKQHGFFTDNSYSEETKGVLNVIKQFIRDNSIDLPPTKSGIEKEEGKVSS